jgi:hypothetical protein
LTESSSRPSSDARAKSQLNPTSKHLRGDGDRLITPSNCDQDHYRIYRRKEIRHPEKPPLIAQLDAMVAQVRTVRAMQPFQLISKTQKADNTSAFSRSD